MNGKGSAPRPMVDRDQFRRRWDETFKRKPKKTLRDKRKAAASGR